MTRHWELLRSEAILSSSSPLGKFRKIARRKFSAFRGEQRREPSSSRLG